ncbi:MAG: carboxypeptidase-like regulatory domain-containing protein [Bacteroidota bacterium]
MSSRKMFFFLVVLTMLSTSSCTAQVKGVVLDRITKEPVKYAYIAVLDTKYATTSDENGAFNLKTPRKKNRSIRISCIGYKTLDLKLGELKNEIYLEPQTYDLQEVVVQENKLRPQDFIAKAYSKIEENYIVSDHLLTGYLKEGEFDNNDPIYLAESIIENKLPTTDDLYPNVKIRYLDKRKKIYRTLSDYKLTVKKGGAWRSVKYSMIDPINAMSPAYFGAYEYEIKGFENYKGRRVVVISFGNNARLAVYGLFFIDLETYAFIRLEGNQLHGDGGPFDNWKWKHHTWIEEYTPNDTGQYYLEGSLYVGNWINKRSKKEYEFRSSFITDTLEYQKTLSPKGTLVTRKQSFLESITESKEDLLKNSDVQNIKLVEQRLYNGLEKYSRVKRPYRR